jgi:hypothetical protein
LERCKKSFLDLRVASHISPQMQRKISTSHPN